MNWTDRWAPPPRAKTRTELRKFGFVMAGATAVIGAIALWRHKGWAPVALGIAALFLLLALVAPRLLRPIEHGWMALAERLGRVTTAIVLTLSFYLVITPFGLLRRLVSSEGLAKKPNPDARSYWITVPADGSASRPDKPF